MIPYLFFQKKRIRSSKLLVSKLYFWECSTTVGWKTGVLTLCSPAHGVGVSKEDSRTEDWTLNLTGLVWVDFHKWHQIELIVIKNGGNWYRISLLNLKKINNLVFTSIASLLRPNNKYRPKTSHRIKKSHINQMFIKIIILLFLPKWSQNDQN